MSTQLANHRHCRRCAADPRIKIWYTLDRPTDSWKYDKGFISEDMIRKHLPSLEQSPLVCFVVVVVVVVFVVVVVCVHRADAPVRSRAHGQVRRHCQP